MCLADSDPVGGTPSLASVAQRPPLPTRAGRSRPQRPPWNHPLRDNERLTDRALRGSAPIARRKGIPNLPRFACADRPSAASASLRWGDPSLAPCYPRLRQVAFGMYMPRFNADVQTQKREAKCEPQHQPHRTLSRGGASPTCGWVTTSSARTP
jgi:hypothetical protein